jgi:hypothetical protein
VSVVLFVLAGTAPLSVSLEDHVDARVSDIRLAIRGAVRDVPAHGQVAFDQGFQSGARAGRDSNECFGGSCATPLFQLLVSMLVSKE